MSILHDTRKSAFTIVGYIIDLHKTDALDIQREMVDEHKNIVETLDGQPKRDSKERCTKRKSNSWKSRKMKHGVTRISSLRRSKEIENKQRMQQR